MSARRWVMFIPRGGVPSVRKLGSGDVDEALPLSCMYRRGPLPLSFHSQHFYLTLIPFLRNQNFGRLTNYRWSNPWCKKFSMIGQKIFLTMTQKCKNCPKIRKIRKIVKNRKNDAFLRPNIGQKVEKIAKIWPKSRKNAKISLIIPLESQN